MRNVKKIQVYGNSYFKGGKSMKKQLSIVLSMAMAASVLTAVPAMADGGDVVNLTIWSPTDREAVEAWWVEKLAEWNEEHPEIQVSREAIDRSDSYAYDNKIATAVTSNDLPSIFYVDGPQVSYYAANGIIVPITEYFSEEDMADIVPSTVAQCTYDGELYAMSATESGVAFYYNKDMLKEAGIDTDDLDSRTLENPVTWEEMADIAEKCTTDEHVGAHIIMDHGEGLPYALEPMYISKGKDYISEDGKTAEGYVDSEEAVETTAYLADLIAKGYANVDPIQDEFLNGACATMIGGSWEVATLEANATFDWGVTYYPVSDTGKAVSPCGDWSAAISRDCENVEAAGEFLQWLMSTDNVATYAAAIAKPATRNSAYENEAMADYADGPRALFVEQLNNTAVPRPRTPSYATFSANYAEAMTNIFSDAATNGEVDTDYIQDELTNVAELFTEDYETYYAE
jgi:ABC-type glycerol-3-phosphate transport system substrate-binding protein